MLLLRPTDVRFDGLNWTNVLALAVSRTPEREVVAWNDLGPHPTFADVPERRTTLTIVRAIASDELADPELGRQGTLTFTLTRSASDASLRRAAALCVVTSVKYDLAGAGTPRQTITLIALAPSASSGAGEPIVITE